MCPEDFEATEISSEGYTSVPGFAEWQDLTVDESEVLRELNTFNQAKAASDGSNVDQVLARLTRQAAAESVAIEGFYELKPGESRTIAHADEGWEEAIAGEFARSRALFDSQLDAFKYAIGYAQEGRPVTELFMRELHAIACRGQQTYVVFAPAADGRLLPQYRELKHGCYKESANSVVRRDCTVHYYAPAIDTAKEMDRLVKELSSEDFRVANPLIQASYSHHALTFIHPFSDGNGRVARSLASMYSYRGFGVPILVYADRKMTYLQALEQTSAGQYEAMVSHIAARVADALAHARQELHALNSLSAEQHLDELIAAVQAYPGISLGEARKIAERIVSAVRDRVHEKVGTLISASQGNLLREDAPSYRESGNFDSIRSGYVYSPAGAESVRLRLVKPAEVGAAVYFIVGIDVGLEDSFPFCVGLSTRGVISRMDGSEIDIARFRFEDCYPELGGNALDRIDMLIDAGCSYLIERLSDEMRKMLRQAGHLK